MSPLLTMATPPSASRGSWRASAHSSSLRSAAVKTGDNHRDHHPCEWGRCGHETRCAQTVTGAARLLGTNYRRGMRSRCYRASSMHHPGLHPRSSATQSLGRTNGHQKVPQAPHRETLPMSFMRQRNCRYRPWLPAALLGINTVWKVINVRPRPPTLSGISMSNRGISI